MEALFPYDPDNPPEPGEPSIQDLVTNVKNWKREWKSRADNNPCWDVSNGYLCYVDGQPVNRYAEGQIHIPMGKFIISRGFNCDKTDGQVAYIVLEDAEGNFTLGNYIGD
jgi:hypothetical protein